MLTLLYTQKCKKTLTCSHMMEEHHKRLLLRGDTGEMRSVLLVNLTGEVRNELTISELVTNPKSRLILPDRLQKKKTDHANEHSHASGFALC